MSRFVRPETRTLTISNGDTLIVKKQLNAGEQRARFERMSLAGVDGSLKVNRTQVGLATITSYLLDWSLKDDDGKPVTIAGASVDDVTAILDALDVPSFSEIREAIEAHEAEMEAEQAAKKKGHNGETKSSVILPSVA